MKVSPRDLAIHGGNPARTSPMPVRSSLGIEEKKSIIDALEYYELEQQDPGYQGKYERQYTDAFVTYMGENGYADAVCTGTVAVYIAIAALQLPKKSHVLVSPVTDPGTINAIILNGLTPLLLDSKKDSYNVDVPEFERRLTKETRAAVVVHSGGKTAPIEEITSIAHDNGTYIIEDCSQAHGAKIGNKKVGTFGDIAVFSTMYRKAHITGGCGGIIFTKNEDFFRTSRAFADRGKPFWINDFDDKNPNQFLFPSLNFNQDEISCAIGIQSLKRLDETIEKRIHFLEELRQTIIQKSIYCIPSEISKNESPFFYPIQLKKCPPNISKTDFAVAIQKEGISLNPHYQYVISEWPYIQSYLGDTFSSKNALHYRNSSFNLLLNENYGGQEVYDISESINKVESAYFD